MTNPGDVAAGDRTRRLGRSELLVSAVGMGCWPIGPTCHPECAR